MNYKITLTVTEEQYKWLAFSNVNTTGGIGCRAWRGGAFAPSSFLKRLVYVFQNRYPGGIPEGWIDDRIRETTRQKEREEQERRQERVASGQSCDIVPFPSR
jgi:hypothetical protein